MEKSAKEGSLGLIFIVMAVSLGIASLWDTYPVIKDSVHSVLNPSLGAILNYNLTWGMMFIVLLISIITTVIQKYATDQDTLKELKREQKLLQEEMKLYKDHPEKLMALQKKQFEFIPQTFKLTSRALVYTAIPFILLFRWFGDYFATMPGVKFFGFFSWFWFYLIFIMVFSSIIRKKFDVV